MGPETDTVSSLVESLPYCVVGEGPTHPHNPAVSLVEIIASHLDRLGIRELDPDYAAFLEMYAGAHFDEPEGKYYIDIFGFIDGISTNLLLDEGPIVEDGFYRFCSSIFQPGRMAPLHDVLGVDFALRLQGDNELRVYRCLTREGVEEPFQPYCASFIDWLRRLKADPYLLAS